ncbi:MAG: MFS transporter [Planctomyces sp.]|nr:MFS transporter [Planctomyces sp.]
MHGIDATPAPQDLDPNSSRPWYSLLNRYHWFVLGVAALGWLFDCLDQQLFVLARPAAMEGLLPTASQADRVWWGDISTSVFIAGWATGGLFFGMLGDRIGRAKTMIITILAYSLCTGLSAASRTVYDFAFYRFLTGLGVGGEFAVGVALVAEVMPGRARPYALGLLQALSAIGNISAAMINLGLGLADGEGLPIAPWRIMFLIGAFPALLALVIRARLREPEAWQRASHDGLVQKQLGSYRELFSHPVWRRHALLGLVLACSGVIGLWAIGFYSPDLARRVQQPVAIEKVYAAQISAAEAANDTPRVEQLARIRDDVLQQRDSAASDADVRDSTDRLVRGELTKYQSAMAVCINIGAFLGMFCFGPVSQRIGRKPTFVIALLGAFFSTAALFWHLEEMWQIFVLGPIMGFFQLALFGGYAIYFPELFPTRLRSTGTSFCYNVGRFLAAFGPLIKSQLNVYFSDTSEPMRYAGVTMCVVFLVGLVVLPFLPETRNQPLPE